MITCNLNWFSQHKLLRSTSPKISLGRFILSLFGSNRYSYISTTYTNWFYNSKVAYTQWCVILSFYISTHRLIELTFRTWCIKIDWINVFLCFDRMKVVAAYFWNGITINEMDSLNTMAVGRYLQCLLDASVTRKGKRKMENVAVHAGNAKFIISMRQYPGLEFKTSICLRHLYV